MKMCLRDLGRAERQVERKSQAGSALFSAEPKMGLEPTNHEITTRNGITSRMLNRLSHPGARVGTGFKGGCACVCEHAQCRVGAPGPQPDRADEDRPGD